MRHLLIGCILLLAACGANTTDLRTQMDACGDATQPDAAMTACNHLLIHEALPDKTRAYVYYSRARAAMEKQDLVTARSSLGDAIRLDRSQSVSFATRGLVHGMMDDMEAAILDFTDAIKLNPQDAVSFQNRGKAYSDSGKQTRAVQDFTRAIELGHDESANRNGRCWARATLGLELDLAREDCEAAVRMEPADGNNHNSLAFVRFRSGDYAGAISDYTTSLSLDPDGASSYYMRGQAKAMTGDTTAQADIDKGLGLEPGIADRYAGYGIASKDQAMMDACARLPIAVREACIRKGFAGVTACPKDIEPQTSPHGKFPFKSDSEFWARFVVGFIIDRKGAVHAPHILSTDWRPGPNSKEGPEGYQQAALASIRQWTYPPRPAPCRRENPFEVSMGDVGPAPQIE